MPSPFQTLFEAKQAHFGEGAGFPLDFGEPAAEDLAITGGVGVFDRSAWEVLLVRGEDAGKFLNGLTTNDVESLQPGVLGAGLFCSTKGKILHAVDVVGTRPDQFLLICEPGDGNSVAGHLESYHIREAVEIGRVPLVCIDVLGPGGETALATLGHSPGEAIGSFHDAPVIAATHPLGALPRKVVLVPEPVAALWLETLLQQAPEARLIGSEAYERACIAAGVPRFGVDYGTDNLPAEGALHDRLCFTKGCYVGQEVHARLHYRGHVNRKLMALEFPAEQLEALQVGAPLYAEGAEVGTLTGLASPMAGEGPQGRARGVAMVRHEQAAARAHLSLSPAGPPLVDLHPMATDLGAERS